ncbi:YkvA family protein [Halomonas sp. KRD171]|uniref:YkvA family protein n=1 Tax=Halomonas sp. KRD171 TaxID=2729726 RepID=UPI0019D1B9A9|nr:YkvA family protein [Halomonas sp. KRD171]
MSKLSYSAEYSDSGFWKKMGKVIGKIGYETLEQALKLYYAARDPDTPTWCKGVIYSSLGYLISPLDAIPDITPVVGYSDDIAILSAAIVTVAAHIKDEHVKNARDQLQRWFT